MESRQWVLEARDPGTDLKQRFLYSLDQSREEEDSMQQRGNAPQLEDPWDLIAPGLATKPPSLFLQNQLCLEWGCQVGGTQPKMWGSGDVKRRKTRDEGPVHRFKGCGSHLAWI